MQAPASRQKVVTVIARSRKRKRELDCNHVTERLLVDGTEYIFRQALPPSPTPPPEHADVDAHKRSSFVNRTRVRTSEFVTV